MDQSFTAETLGDLATRIELLRLSLFGQHLDEATLVEMAERATPVSWKQSDVICQMRSLDADECWVLASGSIRVDSVPNVPPITEVGNLIGELAILDPTRQRSATLRAHGAVEALRISYADLAKFMTPALKVAMWTAGIEVLRLTADAISEQIKESHAQITVAAMDGDPSVMDQLDRIPPQLTAAVEALNVLMATIANVDRRLRLGAPR